MREATDLELGFHAHDNLTLAFANTITAIERGVTWMDGCVGGAGKGGNLSTERIALHLQSSGHGRFDLFTLATVAESWLSCRSLRTPGFWEAVNGTLDLDLPECTAAGAVSPTERPHYYHATHGLSLAATHHNGGRVLDTEAARTSVPTATGGLQ